MTTSRHRTGSCFDIIPDLPGGDASVGRLRRLVGWPATAALVLGLQLLVAITFVNCGDGKTGPSDPRSALDVAVATIGEDLDPDGYALTLDGTQSRPVGVNETVTFSGLTAGSHRVELIDVAPNCSVTGSNPTTLVVVSDVRTTLSMSVTCTALTGDLGVNVSTAGTDLDPDGYMVDVRPAPVAASAAPEGPGVARAENPSQSQPVDVNGTVTFPALRADDYTVELTDLAPNCTIAEANPVTVNVPPNGTASHSWTIGCTALVGDLQVSTSTDGSDFDPDGYTVTVDGGPGLAIATAGTVTLTGLTEGDHNVALTGIAGNCTVAGANPRSVTVPFGSSVSTAFSVTCAPTVGSLTVTTTTSGSDVDPDGYAVTIDGTQSQSVGVNATVTSTGLAAGDHSVELTGIFSNCTVSGANPRTVTVPVGGTASTAFSLSCTARTGDVTVTTNTNGSDLDPDGYSVSVDGTISDAIGISGSITVTGLVEGDHSVELTGLADNCSVSGANPRTVAVAYGAAETVDFSVTCAARVGDLQVTTTTSGSNLDPDGYGVSVDGGPSQAIGVNGSVSLTGLAEGDHTVQLMGVATNCIVSGNNPRTVTVVFSGTSTTTFVVTCAVDVGDLAVTATTSGSDPDPDGYTVTVDGGATQVIGSNGSVTFTGVAQGDRSVALTGVANNCTVSGGNPRTVAVAAGGTVSTVFLVSCVPRVGAVQVVVATTGSDLDPDGYEAAVDGGPGQPIGLTGSVTFVDLGEGDHQVHLTGLADNCTVGGPNPRTVTVVFGETYTAGFAVTCASRIGHLAVSATTTGADLDPDGYTVAVDGGPPQVIAINESLTFPGLAEGDHSVELMGTASNCTVSGANPRTVSVPYNGTASTAFSVACVSRVGDLDVTAATIGSDPDPDGYTVIVDSGPNLSIASNGSVTFTGLTEGDHTVELAGIAGNCTVGSPTPRTVTVPFAAAVTTTFEVTCVARLGDLAVTTNTTGSDLDPDGYAVAVDGGSSQAIGIDASLTFPGLAEGNHSVELTGVAGNCAVSGANPSTVAVPFAGTATTVFTVSCNSRVGDLEVFASTTGSDVDPDGFTVTVVGGPAQSVASNGTITFTGLAEGDHSVELTGVAANCTLSGANPRTVTVPFAGTAATTFAVTCVPRVGDLDLTAATTGSDLDPDGYTVTVDGGPAQPLALNGTVTFSGLAEGDHSVELSGIAGNCTLSGANPRTVTVPFASTAATTFAVTCVARLGDLAVTAATTGSDLDPDGYTVTVDGGGAQPIALNGTVTFSGLAEGDHSVALGGLAGNCTASGANPRTVTVPFASTAATMFAVTCVARLGDLAVTATTTGSDLDPDGYTVTVDGGPVQPLASNGTVTFSGLAEGDHSVALSGLAGNCTASGANPRTITVPFAGTATTTFAVSCIPRVGDLEATAATTGSDLDPDGYTVTVDGGPAQPLALTGMVTFSGLAEGDHSVALSGIAGNCTASGANPRTVTVPFNGTATTTFAVTCVARLGDLDVTAATTGSDLDLDGYTVTVDGGPVQPLASNGTVTFSGLAEGDHSVALSGIAGNCTVSGANPRTGTVSFNGTATTTFAVTCVARLGDLDVMAATTGSDLDPDGYTVTVDGGPTQSLAINGTVRFSGLAEGDHSVVLSGIAGNCTLSGANPRTVTVPFDNSVTTVFGVTCTAIELVVTVSTSGTNLDPDGYLVTVDGLTSQPTAIGDTVQFLNLVGGPHSVELSGVANSCTVVSWNPQTATVQSGQTAFVTFSVRCGDQILVGAGDIAACGSSGDEATAAILDTIPGAVFTAGDNANPDGTSDEFTNCYDPTWGRHLTRTRPTPGNRDYNTPGAVPYFAYFGSSAGTPGEGWYSYDLGSWHVVALNTEANLSVGSTQYNWLVSDLSASSAQCTVVYYHHPLFASTSANNKTVSADAWVAMYAAGVELVVNGHAQIYERFAPQAPDGTADPTNGIREIIVGTGGHQLHNIASIAPNSEVRDNVTFGVLVLTLRNGSYDWEFVPGGGGTFTDSGSGTCH